MHSSGAQTRPASEDAIQQILRRHWRQLCAGHGPHSHRRVVVAETVDDATYFLVYLLRRWHERPVG